jgi:hypothetical protein
MRDSLRRVPWQSTKEMLVPMISAVVAPFQLVAVVLASSLGDVLTFVLLDWTLFGAQAMFCTRGYSLRHTPSSSSHADHSQDTQPLAGPCPSEHHMIPSFDDDLLACSRLARVWCWIAGHSACLPTSG